MNEVKNVLITGAAQGIGAGIAWAFGRKGYHVIAADLEDSPLQQTVRDLVAEGFDVSHAFVDVTDVRDLNRQIEEIDRDTPLSTVVANAGVAFEKSFALVTETEFDWLYSVNVKGTYFTIQAAFKCMAKRGSGAIIAIASTSSFTASTGHMTVYDSSKGAVRSLVGAVAKEVAPAGVRVNAIAPGTVATKLTKQLSTDQQLQEMAEKKIPMKRLGEPNEIGEACVFLSSDAASYVCGHTLVVDGGWLT